MPKYWPLECCYWDLVKPSRRGVCGRVWSRKGILWESLQSVVACPWRGLVPLSFCLCLLAEKWANLLHHDVPLHFLRPEAVVSLFHHKPQPSQLWAEINLFFISGLPQIHHWSKTQLAHMRSHTHTHPRHSLLCVFWWQPCCGLCTVCSGSSCPWLSEGKRKREWKATAVTWVS